MAVSWVRISFPGQGTSGPGDMAVDWLTRGTEKSVYRPLGSVRGVCSLRVSSFNLSMVSGIKDKNPCW